MAEFGYSFKNDQYPYPVIPFIMTHAPCLQELDVGLDIPLHWPERLPVTLRELSVELHWRSYEVHHFDENRIRRFLQSAVNITNITISWRKAGERREISFNPIIKAPQYPDEGPRLAPCPRLQELSLIGISIRGSDLFKLSWERNQALVYVGLEFCVSTTWCPLLPDMTKANFKQLKTALATPNRINLRDGELIPLLTL
jgi:hypothetical protein